MLWGFSKKIGKTAVIRHRAWSNILTSPISHVTDAFYALFCLFFLCSLWFPSPAHCLISLHNSTNPPSQVPISRTPRSASLTVAKSRLAPLWRDACSFLIACVTDQAGFLLLFCHSFHSCYCFSVRSLALYVLFIASPFLSIPFDKVLDHIILEEQTLFLHTLIGNLCDCSA